MQALRWQCPLWRIPNRWRQHSIGYAAFSTRQARRYADETGRSKADEYYLQYIRQQRARMESRDPEFLRALDMRHRRFAQHESNINIPRAATGAIEKTQDKLDQFEGHPPETIAATKGSADPALYTGGETAISHISPILLRDLCECPKCVDPSTRQKLFSTTDIPDSIRAHLETSETGHRVRWTNDIADYGEDHISEYAAEDLERLSTTGSVRSIPRLPGRVLWDDTRFRKDTPDVNYEAYMSDDRTLYTVLQALHTHGLVFITDVPETETSVSAVAERIGPLKNTFYGYTWDVRSVPQAKNVANTAQNLGFHMDLLYMEQPPHLQFLHCIRSSSAGGASLFTDSFEAVVDLLKQDENAFAELSKNSVEFHYDHPESQLYYQRRRVIDLPQPYYNASGVLLNQIKNVEDLVELISAVSWSPPFQAPFTASHPSTGLSGLNERVKRWHSAARKFDALVHRAKGIYERMMKPGECVLFDNRRVLHARKAFEVGDIGKERWLRGAYLDKDPYISRLRVLGRKFGDET